jgi:hypothetical protein
VSRVVLRVQVGIDGIGFLVICVPRLDQCHRISSSMINSQPEGESGIPTGVPRSGYEDSEFKEDTRRWRPDATGPPTGLTSPQTQDDVPPRPPVPAPASSDDHFAPSGSFLEAGSRLDDTFPPGRRVSEERRSVAAAGTDHPAPVRRVPPGPRQYQSGPFRYMWQYSCILCGRSVPGYPLHTDLGSTLRHLGACLECLGPNPSTFFDFFLHLPDDPDELADRHLALVGTTHLDGAERIDTPPWSVTPETRASEEIDTSSLASEAIVTDAATATQDIMFHLAQVLRIMRSAGLHREPRYAACQSRLSNWIRWLDTGQHLRPLALPERRPAMGPA